MVALWISAKGPEGAGGKWAWDRLVEMAFMWILPRSDELLHLPASPINGDPCRENMEFARLSRRVNMDIISHECWHWGRTPLQISIPTDMILVSVQVKLELCCGVVDKVASSVFVPDMMRVKHNT